MTTQFTCVVCGSTVTPESDDETRCGSCGTKFAPPWSDPEVVHSPVPETDFVGADPAPTATDGAGDEAVMELDGSGSVTVTITIEVEPGGA